MKILAYILMGVAVLSLILGIIFAIINFQGPFMLTPGGYMSFTTTCLLFAIAFILLALLETKK